MCAVKVPICERGKGRGTNGLKCFVMMLVFA